MPGSLFNKFVDLLLWNFKSKTTSLIFLIFFNKFCRSFKNTFLQDTPDECFWYLENLTFKLLILNQFVHSINIVGTLYLTSRNVDSGPPFYRWIIIRTIFSLKNVVQIPVGTQTFKQWITLCMDFVKSNSLKTYFLILNLFHVFQNVGFSGSSFFGVQLFFQSPGPGFRSSHKFCWNF